MKDTITIWIRVLRMFAFTGTIIPVTAGAVYAGHTGYDVQWLLFPLVLIAALLYHGGVNLVSEYYDYLKGVDRYDTFGSSGVLVQGLLLPRHVLWAGLVFLAAGTAIGGYFIFLRGWPIMVIGIIGLAGAYGYTAPPLGYKYTAMGDFGVFILMGPLMTIGSFYMVTGSFCTGAVLIGIPIGCLLSAILCANNLRDIKHDIEAGIRTLATVTGHRGAQVEYILLVCAAYVCIAIMVISRLLPWWSLLVFLAMPQGMVCIKQVFMSSPTSSEAMRTADIESAKHQGTFGGLLIISLIIAIFMKA